MENANLYAARGDYPTHRALWNRVVAVLLAVSFAPLILIGGLAHFYASRTIKRQVVSALEKTALHHKTIIDAFLKERIADLTLLSATRNLEELTRLGTLEGILKTLQAIKPWCEDIGVIDHLGNHLAYAGPFDLLARNYRDAPWFDAVMNQGIHVSDVFLGFRNQPHFILAVKAQTDSTPWILRATVLAEHFDRLVAHTQDNLKTTAFLVNRQGLFQTRIPDAVSADDGRTGLGPVEPFEGIRMVSQARTIQIRVWLDQAPWLCVVSVSQDVAFAEFRKIQTLSIGIFLFSGFLIVLVVWFTTDHLITQIETGRRRLDTLNATARSAGVKASTWELCLGVFREIREVLSNIDVMAQVMEASDMAASGPKPLSPARDIRNEAIRGHLRIDTLLAYTQTAEPLVTEVNLQQILTDLILLLEAESRYRQVRITGTFPQPSPVVRSVAPDLRHVFQVLLLDQLHAASAGDTITLSVVPAKEDVTVTFKGSSIYASQSAKATASPRKWDYPRSRAAISVCREILERLGGKISLDSVPREEALVIVVRLPFRLAANGGPTPVPEDAKDFGVGS